MTTEKVWMKFDELLAFLQKNKHILPCPVTFTQESLDSFLAISAEKEANNRTLCLYKAAYHEANDLLIDKSGSWVDEPESSIPCSHEQSLCRARELLQVAHENYGCLCMDTVSGEMCSVMKFLTSIDLCAHAEREKKLRESAIILSDDEAIEAIIKVMFAGLELFPDVKESVTRYATEILTELRKAGKGEI